MEAAKEGEVLPAQPQVDLIALATAAEPLIKQLTDSQLAEAQEETKRLEMKLAADARAERNDFTILALVVTFALLSFATALGFGLLRSDTAITSSAITGLGAFLAGFGTGRTTKRPN